MHDRLDRCSAKKLKEANGSRIPRVEASDASPHSYWADVSLPTRNMSTGPRVKLARFVLIICCALLSAYQCWTLLKLFRGEPVSVTTSFTPWEDVDVPGVTICSKPFAWQEYKLLFGMTLPVGQQLWKTGLTAKKMIHSCEPECQPNADIEYPAGEVKVGIGTWSTWVSLTEGSTCHTLIPNVTWGQLAEVAGHKRFDLELQIGGRHAHCDYRVFVHPRRRPVVANPGVRGVQQDLRQRNACHRDNNTADKIHVKLVSRIHDRETLNRAPCNPRDDYHYETCIIDCSYRQWAEKHNCSTPEMLEQYPDLIECSRKAMKRLLQAGGLTANASNCACLPACRRRSFLADTGVESLPLPTNVLGKILTVQMSAAALAEEITTERRSYPLSSMFSEMGGFVSLVLGVSVLSVADMLTEMLTKSDRGGRPAPATGADDKECRAALTRNEGARNTAPTDTGNPRKIAPLHDSPAVREIRAEQGSTFTLRG